MKKILCYGDSNTYGFIPGSGERYDKNTRWSGLLSSYLTNYKIIEEGMNNRNGFFKNPASLKLSGGDYLPVFLQNHKDIDICILALGTNDAQFFYNLNEITTVQGLKRLINSVREVNPKTKIIIVPPVKISENILEHGFAIQFDRNSIEVIKKIFPLYKNLALSNGCLYFDFNEFVTPSELDGLHFSADSHKIIAKNLAEFIFANFE